MKINEQDIQGLKAQEAKDLAIKLLGQLDAQKKGPISPGEVQLKELEFELKLKEAESEDNRQRESHEQHIRELELQIEQEKTRHAEANGHAQRIRDEHARLIEQVRGATESLGVQMERATREHNLRIEQLESDFAAREGELRRQREDMEARRESLLEEIHELADVKEAAQEIRSLRETMETRRTACEQELQQLEEQEQNQEFEKTKKITHTKRQQELALAELEMQHKKSVLELNQQAAEKILGPLGLMAVEKDDWDRQQCALEEQQTLTVQQQAEIRDKARDEIRKEFNITAPDAIDVTQLYYREQALSREVESLRVQTEKLDTEIRRMREHIEQEPRRLATAVEAAKAQIQNYIEQAPKR